MDRSAPAWGFVAVGLVGAAVAAGIAPLVRRIRRSGLNTVEPPDAAHTAGAAGSAELPQPAEQTELRTRA
jgi:hypothetical protein